MFSLSVVWRTFHAMPSRSAEYFAAHADEANEIIASCTAGKVRGVECDNAREGLRIIASAKAMKHVEQPVSGGAGLSYKRP